MDLMANVLLAAGASPAMVHSIHEIDDFTAGVHGLCVNVGTLSHDWIPSMNAAAAVAFRSSRPWVLDPVAASVSEFRMKACRDLVRLHPAVIRGNADEILALAGGARVENNKGADSSHESIEAADAAKSLAKSSGAVVAVSGEMDYITDGVYAIGVKNGNPMLQKITATGCAVTALITAFVAVEPLRKLEATACALSIFGLAAEMGMEVAKGPASLRVQLIDSLYALDEHTVASRETDPNINFVESLESKSILETYTCLGGNRNSKSQLSTHFESEGLTQVRQANTNHPLSTNKAHGKNLRIDWSDEIVYEFLEICINISNLGHKPGSHLDSKGYEILQKKLAERTGKVLSRVQLKNKFEKLRKEWYLWRTLESQAEISWNPRFKTWEGVDDQWWENFKLREPLCEKYRYKSIKFPKQLAALFGGKVDTSEQCLVPASIVHTTNSTEDDNLITTDDPQTPSDSIGVPHTCHRRRSLGSTSHSTTFKDKRSKTSADKQRALDSIYSVGSFIEEIHNKKKSSTIGKCVDLLREHGVDEESDLWTFAMLKFEKPRARELFVDIEPPSQKIKWLKMSFDASFNKTM